MIEVDIHQITFPEGRFGRNDAILYVSLLRQRGDTISLETLSERFRWTLAEVRGFSLEIL